MSSLTVEEEQKWLPTSVQVTVLRGRGLRGKGKHGTSDVYTIIQLGKEKYCTGVAEKTTEPEWREECSFELQPGALQSGGPAGGGSAGARGAELLLTVMHRALIGMDVFLGQAAVRLDRVFHDARSGKNQWYRLNSKTGKKEKERGEIQVSVQFTRNNLTASMYDLVMKDKSASTFSKLKEHMRGKRRSGDKDASSAVLPGGYGSLYRMRQRLPSDGGGEEDYEDDEGGEARRSKMRTFFLRGKLRKSSDTRSSTSLGSESSESSSRGGSLSPTAGISVVVSDLSNSPSNSSNLTADNSPEHTANTSPKSSSVQGEFGDEAGEISIAVPRQPVCVNGSHAGPARPPDPAPGPPAGSLGLGLLHKSLPLSTSLQNLRLRPSAAVGPPGAGGPAGDGRRWSFDKPGEEEKAAIAAALERSGPLLSDQQLEEDPTGPGPAGPAPDKHKAWFGSRDSHSKPSPVETPPPPNPPSAVAPPSGVPSLHHTNPFCPPQTTPPPISPQNPFFSLLQQNPFYDLMLTAPPPLPSPSPRSSLPPLPSPSPLPSPPPRSSPPPLPFLSSARPPIAQLFPRTGEAAPTRSSPAVSEESAGRRRPLPPVPGWKTSLESSSNPLASAAELEPDSDWDESFEAFAAGRLQSPGEQDEPPPAEGAGRDSAARLQACPATGRAIRPPTAPPLFLQTVPELKDFQSHKPQPNAAGAGPDLSPAGVQWAPCGSAPAPCDSAPAPPGSAPAPPGSSSPDVTSSGLGSSAEEDFLSVLSSSEDTEGSVRGVDESSLGRDGSRGSASDRSSAPRSQTVDSSGVQNTGLLPAPSGEASARCRAAANSRPAPVRLPTSPPRLRRRLADASREEASVGDSHIELSGDAGSSAAPAGVGRRRRRSGSQDSHSGEAPPSWSTSEPNRFSSRRDGSGAPSGSRGDGSKRPVSGSRGRSPGSLPAAWSSRPAALGEGGVEPQVAFSHEALLRRSRSEGALAPALGGALRPSFGSDPGAARDSAVALPGADPPSVPPPAPPLTPPVALSAFPPPADAPATFPPGVLPVSAPTPRDAERRRPPAAQRQNSPHPVKPLTTAMPPEEKRSVLATGLEKLKSTIHPGRSGPAGETDADRKKPLTEGAGSYYHLTHSELVSLLVQRERDLDLQRVQMERQRVLLAKRELELRRLKPQVRDLEDYIDTLLVRIMEQKPTLLQVRSKFK